MRSTQSRLRGLGGIVAGTLVVTAIGAAPTQADEPSEPAPNIELQARSNLLVNDAGWNLPPGSSFNSITTALNDDGQIAFPVQIATYPGSPTTSTAAVWLGEGSEGDLVHRLPVNSAISSSVFINDAGDVAFTAGDATANTLWMYEAAADEAEQVTTMPVVPTSYSLGGIDEDQNVGFQGSFAGNRAFAAVIDGTGEWYAQDSGMDPDSAFSFLYSATFNDAQQIAAKVSLVESFNHQEIRVFEADGSSEAVLATDNVDEDSPYRSFDNSVALADDGTVAAFATLRAGGKVLVRTDGTTVEHVADTSADSPIASFDFFAPDVNTRGEVVFRGVDKDGNKGIWVADGDEIRPALVQGDVVQTDLGLAQLGQHDSSPIFGGSPRINNRGDVSSTAGVHPLGDNQEEWGTGVFIAYADAPDEPEPPVGVVEIGTSTIEHTVEFGGSDTTDVTFTNTGDADAEVTLASDEDWLTVDPTTFTVDADDTTDVAVTTDAEGLEAGEHTGEITITTDTDQELGPITVTLTVEEAPEPPVEPIEVERWEGANRYGTAAVVAASYEPGVDVVFLTTGLDYPDALTGSALAGSLDAPVLLTRTDQLGNSTTAALELLEPERVIVLGGPEAVEDSVLAEAEAVTGVEVERLEGANRYGTAAAVAGEFGTAEHVFVATGRDYPDALSAAARAGHLDSPVLLVRPDGIPTVTAKALDDLDPSQITVLGGEEAIEQSVVDDLGNWAPATRVGGLNRWITSALLFAEVASADTVYLASGRAWPDALAGGAKAASDGEPLLITRPDRLAGAIEDTIVRLFPDKVVVLGGKLAVHDSVIEELENLRGQD